MIEQLLAQLRRQIGLGIIQKRGDVVLQRALAPALVVEEVRLTVAQHDVARLKIAIEKVVASALSRNFVSRLKSSSSACSLKGMPARRRK